MDLDTLIRRHNERRNSRANWESQWQDIADRVLPQMADFTTKRQDGAVRTERMFDSSAALAATRALAAITSFACPGNQRYQKLVPEGAVSRKTPVSNASKVYLDGVTDKLFSVRYATHAAFEAQMSEALLSFIVFGTGILFVDDMETDPSQRRSGILYKSVPLSSAYLSENSAGMVDTLDRRFAWTLRQINQRFPGKLTGQLLSRLEKNPEEKVDVVQTVCPRDDYDPSGLGGLHMPWASCYFLPDHKVLLEEGGFRTWPFAIMRFMTSSGEVYGRSPAWLAMSNIRTLNTMKRTALASAQKAADPPMLLDEDGALGAFSQAPGANNYGMLKDGKPLAQPLITGARLEITLEMMDKEREVIASANFLDVFKALIDNPNMTATQALELLQERATLMAPIVGRIESEGLGPMTEREVSILEHGGELLELGDVPQDLVAANGAWEVDYTSPARQAMRASEAIAITRTLEQVIPMANVDPSALDAFPSFALISRELGEINGMPAHLLLSVEEIMAKKQERDQQQNVAGAVQAAPQIAAAARNITQMQAAGGRPQV